MRNWFELPLARALSMNGNEKDALSVLEEFQKKAPSSSVGYYRTLGWIHVDQKRDQEALEAFLRAAVNGYQPALENAKTVYVRLNGSDTGFEAELDKLRARNPITPPPFVAPENWRGKTVLAEVFTGSECPPCVAAGYAFDALRESYPTKYLAILKYHLPVPLYDPMINPATKKREDYYGQVIRGVPTAIINGVNTVSVGGARANSFDSFTRAKNAIDPLLETATDIAIKANATIRGDVISVDCQFSKVIEGADYHIVLVQSEEDFKGGNGLTSHKMVVRDIKTVRPSDRASVTFNIPESERLAGEYITEWGKTASPARMRNSSWPQQNTKMDRDSLKVVVFVQDAATRQVHNATVVDVASSRQ
jgi:thiol-disulfide isomerase/thioredoxin